MVSFAGWDMPVVYTGIGDEHMAVRRQVGLFDVSHMGEIEIAGADALEAVQRISCNDASRLEIGQVQYSVLTTHEGTAIDDLLVYRLASDHYMLVVNAANVSKDLAWIREEIKFADDAVVVNSSSRYSLLALQGPCAREVLQPLTGIDLNSIRYYWFDTGEVGNVRATISRTGYTGEDGFELFVPPQSVGQVWDTILGEGLPVDVKPIGLGARDTLRLEASMRLYGNDMDEATTVLEAGLGWVVGWKKPIFNGRDVLTAQKATGISRKLVGFEMLERGIARHGYEVCVDGQNVGVVTSGTQTPYLKKSIGMAYMPVGMSEVGADFEVKIREQLVAARVIKMPFYKRESG
tara:strand:+ start:3321 stop:4367 length:1047 start_codon:yes stop_codon:yes gene_type:complete